MAPTTERSAGSRRVALRLLALEDEERRLAERMQRDRVRRTKIQDEVRHLRIGMKDKEHELYDRLRLVRERV
jgi:hypothetical protein